LITVVPVEALPGIEERLARIPAPICELGTATRGLIWADGGPEELQMALERAPNVEWVQLGVAGIDRYAEAGLLDGGITWTSAKGAFAEPVAEHALALVLALLRELPMRARATRWGAPRGRSLHGARVLLIGGGGIAIELLRLLTPWRVETVVLRRSTAPIPGANRTMPIEALDEQLPLADVVVLTTPLTPQTRHLLDARRLGMMRPDAVLVNVARGAIVDMHALIGALDAGTIAGAGLDVTDPEPLPEGHPFWAHPRALVTPHTADTPEMTRPLLAVRIEENVRRFLAGEPLEGIVDPLLGY